MGFLIGDILGIQNLFPVLGGILGLCALFFYLKGVRIWIYLLILASSSIGAYLGKTAYQEKIEIYNTIVQFTDGFTKKGTIIGSIQKIVYRKERSIVYLFNIDNFDNFDKKYEIPLYKGIDDVELSINSWKNTPSGEKTIFIEVPSNLTLTNGDVIEFIGNMKPNIHFPLVGYDRYAFFHGGYGYIFVTNFRYLQNREPTFIFTLHEKWEHIFTSSFPREVAGIVLGMTIGSTKYLTETVKDTFLTSGITHILVVSGSNIAFLILFLSFFIKYLHTGRWFNTSIVILCIIFYVGIVGIEVPVIRAAIMGILSFLIASAGLRASGRAIIGLTLILLTLIEPLSPLFDAGYGLSFGATLGILLFQKHTENTFKNLRIPKIMSSTLSLTLGASLGSLPILFYHFGSVAIYSIITNILIAGFLGWILFSSTIFGILSLIGIPFLKGAGLLIYIPTKIIIKISHFFSNGFTLSLNQEYSTILAVFLLGFILYYYIFDEENI